MMSNQKGAPLKMASAVSKTPRRCSMLRPRLCLNHSPAQALALTTSA